MIEMIMTSCHALSLSFSFCLNITCNFYFAVGFNFVTESKLTVGFSKILLMHMCHSPVGLKKFTYHIPLIIFCVLKNY